MVSYTATMRNAHALKACAALCLALAVPLAAQGGEDQLSLFSPNGEIELRLHDAYPSQTEAVLPRLSYAVYFRGKLLIATSFLGFDIESQVPLGEKLGLMKVTRESVDASYALVSGKTRLVRDRYNSLLAQYLQNGSQGRLMTVEARAYDDGIAFRYVVPISPPLDELRLTGEVTEFQFARDGDAYPMVVEDFNTGYEEAYQRATLSGIHRGALIALPLLVEQPGVGWAAVTEAALDDYPGMFLARITGRTLKAALAPLPDGGDLVFRGRTPVTTPWRVLLIGDTPAQLIESNLVTSLNPPCEIADTSWIRPGKALTSAPDTAAAIRAVDFAGEAGVDYVLIGPGWAYTANGGTDLTRARPAFDLARVLARASEKNAGIWLWARWDAVEAQMEEAFAQFERWGVRGVVIDGMNRDDQWAVNLYRRMAEAAANHRLMLAFHGAYKPDGMERTWPNVLTREAVLGLEHARWGARANPDHEAALAFTRMLAGPLDYGAAAFQNATRESFEPRQDRPMALGTRAHQLALLVAFESGLQRLAGDVEDYRGAPEFEFVRAVPAAWDETRALGGAVGEYAVIARRSGREWFLGAIAGWRGWDLSVPLDFLGPGEWIAEIYADAEDARGNPRHTRIEQRPVDSSGALRLSLAPGGGAAVRFVPVGAATPQP
jgi:alpha-glucosidase